MPIPFEGNVLIIGYGAVGESALPLLLRHVRIPPNRITVVDFEDKRKALAEWIDRGVTFLRAQITRKNLHRILSRRLTAGDLIIDLAWSVDCIEILAWARNHNVFYVNSSIEEWDPYSGFRTSTSFEKSLYRRYTEMMEVIHQWSGRPTAVLDHGVNPGLISSLLKKGLLNLAAHILRKDIPLSRKTRARIERAAEDQCWAELAMDLGVRVVHCSERDTQITSRPKRPGEFAGMWSTHAMTEECVAPVEIGWGTHEKRMPQGAILPDHGPQNQVIIPQMGMNTWARSWVPPEEFVGMVITHGEAFTLSNLLTVRRGKRVVYRPTVHYVYLPSNETIASLHDMRCRGYDCGFDRTICKDEIEAGADSVGALIMGHPLKSWWTGSVLTIQEARRRVPHQNATTVQVAIGVIAAVVWLIENPAAGVCFPEDLPHEHILRTAKPYLGELLSIPVDWTPLTNYREFFLDTPNPQVDREDVWQFHNFLFKP